MRRFKQNLIQNDKYHKVIDTWAENSSDLNVYGHIETTIKNEVAKKWYQRRNMIVCTKHMEKQISHISTNMETTIGLFGTLFWSYLSSIEATSREWRPGGSPTND
jgi:hypothetical protein